MSKKRIVIAGGGFGGVYAAVALHRLFHKNQDIDVDIVSNKNYFLFTPMLHEVATGSINRENIIQSLRALFYCCRYTFHETHVEGVDLNTRTIRTQRGALPYDYALLSLGSSTNYFGVDPQHVFSLKTIDDAVKLRNHLIHVFEQASWMNNETERQALLTLCVVGGGPTGVEVVCEIQELITRTFRRLYPSIDYNGVRIILIQSANEVLPMFHSRVRLASLAILKRKGITVRLHTRVASADQHGIVLDGWERIDTKTIVWSAGVAANAIDIAPSIAYSKRGQIIVNQALHIPEYPTCFVVGDMAAIPQPNIAPDAIVPQLAQAAVKEGLHAAVNIRASILGRPLQDFIYHEEGKLVSLGKGNAAAEIKHVIFFGPLAWFVWRTIYLSKLIGWRKKVGTAIDWAINLFLPRETSEL